MAARSVHLPLLRVLALLFLIPASLRGQATDIQVFIDLIRTDPERAAVAERTILDGWDDSQAVMLVEVHRFAQSRDWRRIILLLERATGQSLDPHDMAVRGEPYRRSVDALL